jgi:hypothetical protein
LFTLVLQIRRARNHLTRVAGDRAQVLVDCPELMVGHVAKGWPSHDLEKIAVERRLETIRRIAGRSAIWMHVIEIGPVPHDLDELLVGAPALRPPSLVRRQIAGVEVGN